MPFQEIQTLPSLFKEKAEDRQLPEAAGKRELYVDPQLAVDEDMTNLQNWTQSTTGSASITQNSDGTVTLSTGTTNGSRANLVHNFNLGKMQDKGLITVECRARLNVSTPASFTAVWNFGVSDGSIPNQGAQDHCSGGYNTADAGDNKFGTFTEKDGSGGASNNTTYTDDTYFVFKMVAHGNAKITLDIDGETEETDVGNPLPEDEDMQVFIGLEAKAAADQTVIIDWIKAYYSS